MFQKRISFPELLSVEGFFPISELHGFNVIFLQLILQWNLPGNLIKFSTTSCQWQISTINHPRRHQIAVGHIDFRCCLKFSVYVRKPVIRSFCDWWLSGKRFCLFCKRKYNCVTEIKYSSISSFWPFCEKGLLTKNHLCVSLQDYWNITFSHRKSNVFFQLQP